MIVLIADDERLVRFAMKSMLSEFMEDSEDIFLEAVNGRDMVKVCKDKKPDVVLADISMPYMDGLEAISECKKYSPMTQYVIVTGFSEFEYAKRAIHLGVNEYLLKPVDSQKLRTGIEKIKQRFRYWKYSTILPLWVWQKNWKLLIETIIFGYSFFTQMTEPA